MKNIRTLAILLVCMLLTGCPPIYNINIKNEESKSIIIFYHQDGTEMQQIKGNGGEGIEHWSHYCFAINDNGVKYYFDGSSLPDSVYQTHVFSTSLKAIYKNGKLSFLDKNNEAVITVDGSISCN